MAVLHGNNANNTIWAPAGTNTIHGYGGDDVLGGHNSSDVIYGGDGNDTLYPGDDSAPDTLIGGLGDDQYWANGPEDTIVEYAGQGIDTVIAKFSWRLGANLEHLTLQEVGAWANGYGIGNGLNNRILGNTGNNLLDGAAGNDTIVAGAGRDTVYGGDGNDLIDGGTGDDVLDGGNGSDTVSGGEGNDTLYAGDDAAADTLQGGFGNDVFWVNGPEDLILEGANQGIDTVIAKFSWTLGDHVENVTLQEKGASANGGVTGNGLNNVLTGNSGRNLMRGGDGDDTLYGGAGDDQLQGGLGNDRLFGGDGVDRLDFQGGHDTVTGGAGQDFFCTTIVRDPDNLLVITDFQLGVDRLYHPDNYDTTYAEANGGRDTLLTYTDWHDDGPLVLPTTNVVLQGVTLGEIRDYLARSTTPEPLFVGHTALPYLT